MAISRRSLVAPIGIPVVLAAADDVDGVQDATRTFDITGALRALILVGNDGTAGTEGVDVVQISHDGGSQWNDDTDTVLLAASNDVTGSQVSTGALNSAGVEPATAIVGLVKVGPYEGPTLIRINRDTSDTTTATAIDWVTGAPAVHLIPIGLTAGAISAEA